MNTKTVPPISATAAITGRFWGIALSPKQLLVAYLLLVFALSWGLQIGAILTTGDIESAAAEPWLIAAMFTPALVTLLTVTLFKATRSRLLWRGTLRMVPLSFVAVLVPILITFGVVALTHLLNWGKAGWLTFAATGVTIAGGPWLLGGGTQSWLVFIVNVIITGTFFALLNGLIAAGEELGWRGYLQGVLIDRWGQVGGIVVLGLLWALWHLPGQLAGYNYPAHPLLGAFVLSPLELVATSFFLGWLTLRSGSFWPAAIAHGAGNSIQEGVTRNLHLVVPGLYEDLATLLLTLIVGLVCLVLITRTPKRPLHPTNKEPSPTNAFRPTEGNPTGSRARPVNPVK